MSDQSAPKCNCATAQNEETSSSSGTNAALRCCAKQRLWLTLNNTHFSDVCFIVGQEREQEKIHAHRAVLSDSSPVFETMFSNNWSEKSNENNVPDIEPAIFSSLLRFIYTDDIQLTAENVWKTLYAAKKYAVDALESRCCEFVKEQLCADNACLLLTQARFFDQARLMESCLEVIDENPEVVFKSDGFTNLDLAALCSILKRDTLRIYEIDLFEAVVRWSETECLRKNLAVNAQNQKSALDGAMGLIRFPLMTQEEFASKVVPSNLLTKDNVVDIFMCFSGISDTCSGFNRTLRSPKELLTVDRFQYHERYWPCSGKIDGIGFIFDSNVKVAGFGLYVPFREGSVYKKYEFDITVKNLQTGNIIHQSHGSHTRDSDDQIIKYFLKEPLAVTANTLYAVFSKTQALYCYCGDGSMTRYSPEDSKLRKIPSVKFQNIDYEGSGGRTNVEGGQIPQILFSW